jgi:hypothetical protein
VQGPNNIIFSFKFSFYGSVYRYSINFKDISIREKLFGKEIIICT